MSQLSLEGRLVQYSALRKLTAFFSSPVTCDRFVIYIGGLTDGYLSRSYLVPLSQELRKINWSLVQKPIHAHCCKQYGTSSLRQDAEEIDELIRYLFECEGGRKFVLLGSSTGCQDAVTYLRVGNTNAERQALVAGLVLQAPVSDREYMATLPNTQRYLELAEKLIREGKAEELLPREADVAPITAYRYHSLAARMGDDDMFSSDMTAEELRSRLGHVSVPVLSVFSLADEYVPKHVDVPSLAARITAAFPKGRSVLIPDANHSIDNSPEAESLFISSVINFLLEECK